MYKKIVVGIPSYNEEDNIGFVVKQVDLGLKTFYDPSTCLIVNVDSESNDNTKKIFLQTKTFCSKKYLNTGKRARGKGKNLIELFKFCNDLDVDFIVIFDSDIKTIKPDWVFLLLNPLIKGGFDYTAPVYSRGCYDGNVTNNFAYPLTYAVFDVDLQQPIGGEFGLNKRLYKYLLKQPLSKAVLGFGIDIFMTYHAIGGGFKISEVYLGKKLHRPGFSTLMNKFLQFAQSAIEVSKIYKNKLSKIRPIKKCKSIPVLKTKRPPVKNLVSIQLKQSAQDFQKNILEYRKYLNRLTDKIIPFIVVNKKPSLSLDLWTSVIAKFLNFCYKDKFNQNLIPKICNLMAPIFFWRVISFWEEIEKLSPLEIQEKIRNQAKLLKIKIGQ